MTTSANWSLVVVVRRIAYREPVYCAHTASPRQRLFVSVSEGKGSAFLGETAGKLSYFCPNLIFDDVAVLFGGCFRSHPN